MKTPFGKILSALALSLLPTVSAEDAPRPNILVIMCDDLGYADVGFNGSTDIRTPQLDKLADSGTILSSGYVTHPFCGPSRMGFMSGRYSHSFGAPFNLPHGVEAAAAYKGVGIDVDEVLMSTALQRAGYYTGAIGKWHLGIEEQFHPNTRGFDDFFGFLGGGHNYFPEQFEPAYERQKKAGRTIIDEYLHPMERNGKYEKETEYVTDALSREASRFVEDASETEAPFFLFLAYNAPHTPMEAKEEDLAEYSEIEDPKRRTYAAMVHAVDRGVGEVVESLKKTGQFENTLIVFLSDNGGKTVTGANNYPLTAGKGSTYEGGFRVPMFFHWPEHVPAGTTFDYPVSTLDFYPTFVGLGGAAIPEGKVLDGKNIWDDFVAGNNPRKGEMIYALRHRAIYSEIGARRDQWKLYSDELGSWKLFNLDDDIEEKHDLSALYPERMQEMISEVEKWTRTHTEPKWFHALSARDLWHENEMPKYKETFDATNY